MNTMMTATEGLTVVTLVVALISMLLSCMALWPQWKDSLAVVRDTVLWMAVVVVLVAAATVSWNWCASRPSTPSSTVGDELVEQLTADYPR